MCMCVCITLSCVNDGCTLTLEGLLTLSKNELADLKCLSASGSKVSDDLKISFILHSGENG